jgi:hypothetical protein
MWTVFADDQPVLEIWDSPGSLMSTAPRPDASVKHPFLSAVALDAGHEHQLRELLQHASDLPSFLAALRAAGYRVLSSAQ